MRRGSEGSLPRPAPIVLAAALCVFLSAGMPASRLEAQAFAAKPRAAWPFCPPVDTAPPRVKGAGRVRNDLDAFVIAKLEEQGLTLAPEAAPRALVRRLYLDVIGLPPPPAEVEAFLSDPDPRAWEKLVDRLLADPPDIMGAGDLPDPKPEHTVALTFLRLAPFTEHHGDVKGGMIRHSGEVDQPVAALLADLKQRGLLEETLVVWSSEMGRTPFVNGKPGDRPGRDHNGHALCMWMGQAAADARFTR